MRELKRLWQVGGFNVMWLLSQRGHWLPCLYTNHFKTAKFKMVSVTVTLILLFSCVFFPPIFFFQNSVLSDRPILFPSQKTLFTMGSQTFFWLPNPLLSMFREFPSLRKYLFFPPLQLFDVYILPEAQVHPRRAL